MAFAPALDTIKPVKRTKHVIGQTGIAPIGFFQCSAQAVIDARYLNRNRR